MIIALEGIDGSGKTTLARALYGKLSDMMAHGEISKQELFLTRFPNYQSNSGKIINKYLKHQLEIPGGEYGVQLLFALNRLEKKHEIEKFNAKGIVIIDRYIHSGKAYGMSNGLDGEIIDKLNKEVGMREPDAIIYLCPSIEECMNRITKRQQQKERYETKQILEKVQKNYCILLADNLNTIWLPSDISLEENLQLTMQYLKYRWELGSNENC